ncbi:hypothetical protein NST86_31140 [Bacillus sp. FSL L8-0199]|uniref:hypothetical protein n=1 Tax=Bacillus TaxID=1386 RepID=UPI0015942B38|nr:MULTISPECIES: hypothetical protein [Bacillus cereus group]MCU5640379.1 hypothetical protein [Bacillus cereus]MCU5669148.1 hypothetical protein [Bacillus cereus]
MMKDEYSIKEICILIDIPRSTYYRWKNKGKDIKEAKLEQAILTICMTNHFRYGHRKIYNVGLKEREEPGSMEKVELL